jgi:hypothetical protein
MSGPRYFNGHKEAIKKVNIFEICGGLKDFILGDSKRSFNNPVSA